MTASTETLDISTDSAPQALPYHSNTSTLRAADSPKRDATEMYLKSKALLESRRESRLADSCQPSPETAFLTCLCPVQLECFSSTEPHTKDIDVFLKRDIETGFGFRVLGGEGPQQPVSKYITSSSRIKMMSELQNHFLALRSAPSERVSPGVHRGNCAQRSCREGRSSESGRRADWHRWRDGERSFTQAGAGPDDQRCP